VAQAVSEGHVQVVPEVLVAGGGGGSLDGLAASLMKSLSGGPNGNGDGKGGASAKKALDAVVAQVEEQSGRHRGTREAIPEPPEPPPPPAR
jgi:hypothetical protein